MIVGDAGGNYVYNISNSYAYNCTLNAQYDAGGLGGSESSGSYTYGNCCYFDGTISRNSNTRLDCGIFVGHGWGESHSYTLSFYTSRSNLPNYGIRTNGATQLSMTDFVNKTKYTDGTNSWNFDNTWIMVDDNNDGTLDRPDLRIFYTLNQISVFEALV